MTGGAASLAAQEAGQDSPGQTASGNVDGADADLRERLVWMLNGYHFSPDRADLDGLGTTEQVADGLRDLAADTSQRPSLRMRAVEVLGEYDQPEVRSFLDGLLVEPSVELADRQRRVAELLRYRAVTSLARLLEDRRSVEKLAPYLEADDLQLRLAAVRALGEHAGEPGRLRLRSVAGELREPALKDALRDVLPE